jgi:putative signal transducing protein
MSHPDPSSTSRLVMVFGTGSIPEGLLVKGLLESEGIPVQMKGEAEGPYRMGPVSLWVPEAFEVQARLILEEASSDGRRDGEEERANGEQETADD